MYVLYYMHRLLRNFTNNNELCGSRGGKTGDFSLSNVWFVTLCTDSADDVIGFAFTELRVGSWKSSPSAAVLIIIIMFTVGNCRLGIILFVILFMVILFPFGRIEMRKRYEVLILIK